MKNENNTTPASHLKLKKNLRIAGFACLGLGLVLTAAGMISFFSAFTTGEMPRFFFCAFIGLPLCGVGGAMLSFAYRGEVMRYVKNEGMPVVNEAGKEFAPTLRDLSAAAREGWKESETAEGPVCSCGTKNDPGSRFCKNCGNPLVSVCPACGAEVKAGSKFCSSCGNKLC